MGSYEAKEQVHKEFHQYFEHDKTLTHDHRDHHYFDDTYNNNDGGGGDGGGSGGGTGLGNGQLGGSGGRSRSVISRCDVYPAFPPPALPPPPHPPQARRQSALASNSPTIFISDESRFIIQTPVDDFVRGGGGGTSEELDDSNGMKGIE